MNLSKIAAPVVGLAMFGAACTSTDTEDTSSTAPTSPPPTVQTTPFENDLPASGDAWDSLPSDVDRSGWTRAEVNAFNEGVRGGGTSAALADCLTEFVVDNWTAQSVLEIVDEYGDAAAGESLARLAIEDGRCNHLL